MCKSILVAKNLKKHYPLKTSGFSRRQGVVLAVDGVSLEVQRVEVFGLVGESGCGKSTLGRVLLRLEEPTSGRVFFEGQDIGSFEAERLKQFRREATIIYQDPYSALDPRQKIGRLIEEPLVIHRMGDARERRERVDSLLK